MGSIKMSEKKFKKLLSKGEAVSGKPEISPDLIMKNFMNVSAACSKAQMTKAEHAEVESNLKYLASVLEYFVPPTPVKSK